MHRHLTQQAQQRLEREMRLFYRHSYTHHRYMATLDPSVYALKAELSRCTSPPALPQNSRSRGARHRVLSHGSSNGGIATNGGTSNTNASNGSTGSATAYNGGAASAAASSGGAASNGGTASPRVGSSGSASFGANAHSAVTTGARSAGAGSADELSGSLNAQRVDAKGQREEAKGQRGEAARMEREAERMREGNDTGAAEDAVLEDVLDLSSPEVESLRGVIDAVGHASRLCIDLRCAPVLLDYWGVNRMCLHACTVQSITWYTVGHLVHSWKLLRAARTEAMCTVVHRCIACLL